MTNMLSYFKSKLKGSKRHDRKDEDAPASSEENIHDVTDRRFLGTFFRRPGSKASSSTRSRADGQHSLYQNQDGATSMLELPSTEFSDGRKAALRHNASEANLRHGWAIRPNTSHGSSRPSTSRSLKKSWPKPLRDPFAQHPPMPRPKSSHGRARDDFEAENICQPLSAPGHFKSRRMLLDDSPPRNHRRAPSPLPAVPPVPPVPAGLGLLYQPVVDHDARSQTSTVTGQSTEEDFDKVESDYLDAFPSPGASVFSPILNASCGFQDGATDGSSEPVSDGEESARRSRFIPLNAASFHGNPYTSDESGGIAITEMDHGENGLASTAFSEQAVVESALPEPLSLDPPRPIQPPFSPLTALSPLELLPPIELVRKERSRSRSRSRSPVKRIDHQERVSSLKPGNEIQHVAYALAKDQEEHDRLTPRRLRSCSRRPSPRRRGSSPRLPKMRVVSELGNPEPEGDETPRKLPLPPRVPYTGRGRIQHSPTRASPRHPSVNLDRPPRWPTQSDSELESEPSDLEPEVEMELQRETNILSENYKYCSPRRAPDVPVLTIDNVNWPLLARRPSQARISGLWSLSTPRISAPPQMGLPECPRRPHSRAFGAQGLWAAPSLTPPPPFPSHSEPRHKIHDVSSGPVSSHREDFDESDFF